MTLHELELSSTIKDFKSTNTNTLICFSATWCDPCRVSKPQFQALASSCNKDVKFGIVYEHNLQETIHDYNIKAFPTYILYVNHGQVEAGRILGANFGGIQRLIDQHCQHVLSTEDAVLEDLQ